MKLNSLISAIPSHMRKEIKIKSAVMGDTEPPTWYELLLKKPNLSNFAYRRLQPDREYSQKITKWEAEIAEVCNEEQFLKWCKNIYLTTNTPKLRSFQYRLIHRAIITNIHLYKWGKRENDLCSMCGLEKETYTHLFVMCSKIQHIWIGLEQLMYAFSDENINFNVKNVLMNTLVEDPRSVKNTICLIMKQYIYRQRCQGKVVNLMEIKNLVWKTQDIEKYIAVKNEKISQFNKKWHGSIYEQIKAQGNNNENEYLLQM